MWHPKACTGNRIANPHHITYAKLAGTSKLKRNRNPPTQANANAERSNRKTKMERITLGKLNWALKHASDFFADLILTTWPSQMRRYALTLNGESPISATLHPAVTP
jgi:hypothetical protein